MAKESIKVLHIDAGHEWRGGQQQAAYLLENMVNAGYSTKMICPTGSPMQKRCLKKNLSVSGLRLKSSSRLKDARHIARLCRTEGFYIIHAHCSHSLTLALISRLLYRAPKLSPRDVLIFMSKNRLSAPLNTKQNGSTKLSAFPTP